MQSKNMVMLGWTTCLMTLAGTATPQEVRQSVRVKHNFSTVIILPDDQIIKYMVVGDPSRLAYKRQSPNIFSVVPTRPLPHAAKGSKAQVWDGRTNVQAITKSGKTFAFDLQEVDGNDFDETVTIEAAADADPPEPKAPVCDAEIATVKADAAHEKAAMQVKLDQEHAEAVRRVIPAEFFADINENYHIDRRLRSEPFNVKKVGTRGDYTYVLAHGGRQAAFYEKDGKEKRHVNYSFDPITEKGVYIIPGIVTEGCLGIEKAKACFKKKG